MISRGVGVVVLVLLIALSASAAVASQTDWELKMMTYVGSVGGVPQDINPRMGVKPGATDGYDSGIDLSKPPLPFEYVWTWFNRPAWGKGDIQTDYRAEIAEGASKVWGTAASDDTRVKLKIAQDPSGQIICGENYPLASAIYLTWEFTADKLPPTDYTFTLRYLGGINAKPAGTAPGGVTVPTPGTTWDMKTVSQVVFPLWHIDFFPWLGDCTSQILPDTAKFKITVENPTAPNQSPICDFNFAPASPTTADTVQFTDASSDPDGTVVSWAWTFGDGSNSSVQNPTHKYTTANTYTVNLTVTDNGGASTSCSKQVTVTAAPNQSPVCNFTFAPVAPTTADTVQFTDTSTDPDGTVVSWAWTFGDGGNSSLQNPTHQYTTVGTYTVNLTVTDNGGASTQCAGQQITVTSGPSAETNWNCNLRAYWGAIGGLPNDQGDYLGVKPEATDGYDLIDSKKPAEPMGDYVYAWFSRPTWGMGNIMADWRAPVAEGTTKIWGPGISDLLNIKTNKSSSNTSGYFNEECDPLHDLEYPVAASIYFTWAFGVADVPPYPAPPDDYTFTLQYKGGIYAKPAGTKLGDAMDPPALNFTWDMEATPQIVIPLWSIAFTPWRTDCAGLESGGDTAKFKILVYNPTDEICPAPTCGFTYDPTTPNPQATVQFTDTSTQQAPNVIVSWSWTFGDGGTSTQQNPTHQYAAGGDYTVSLTVTNDCQPPESASCQQTIHVNLPPTCAITADPTNPTTADTVQFQSGAADTDGTIAAYAWDFGDPNCTPQPGCNTSTAASPTHRFVKSGTYTVNLTVTDNNGATGTCSLQVTVSNRAPNCSITFTPLAPVPNQVINFNSNATDPDGTIASVSWNFGDGNTGTGMTTTHTYVCLGDYTVNATAVDDEGAQKTCSTLVSVQPGADTTGPTIVITSPALPPPVLTWSDVMPAGSLAADVQDCESGVTLVEFFIDGNKIGEDTTAPYQAPAIDTQAYGNGGHYLGVKATNAMTLTSQFSFGIDFFNPIDIGSMPVISQTVVKTGLLGVAPNYQIRVNLTVKNTGGVAAENVTLRGFVFVGSYLDAQRNLVLVNIPAHPTSGDDWPRLIAGGTLAPGAQETIELLSDVFQVPPIQRVSRWMDYGTFTVGPTTYTF